MKLIVKSMLLLSLIGVPAVAAVAYDNAWPDGLRWQSPDQNASLRPKDEARMTSGDDNAGLLIELAQASRQPASLPDPAQIAQGFPPPPPFSHPPEPHRGMEPFAPFAGMAPPPMPPAPSRSTCEDRINRQVGMAGYLMSKLRLQPSQREAWQKLETAAQPAIDKLHAACANLPAEASAPPSIPDMLDMIEAEMSARLELLRATREPLRTLFASLTPEQRAALQPPLLPPPHFHP